MTAHQDTPLKTKTVAGIALLSLALAFGTFIGSAEARDHGHRGNGDHFNNRHFGDHRGWSGGYYRAPPVIYGDPYRYGYPPPPPVIYSPGIGIYTPGLSIGIH